MNTCNYTYKCGPKKGEACNRKCRNDLCFQHGNQIKKESKVLNPTPKEKDVTQNYVEKDEVQTSDYIQLTNTKAHEKKHRK